MQDKGQAMHPASTVFCKRVRQKEPLRVFRGGT